MGWVKIRSWHVIRTWTRVPNVALTLCGKRASGETGDGFGGKASCESCLRIEQSNTFRAVQEPEDRLTL